MDRDPYRGLTVWLWFWIALSLAVGFLGAYYGQ